MKNINIPAMADKVNSFQNKDVSILYSPLAVSLDTVLISEVPKTAAGTPTN